MPPVDRSNPTGTGPGKRGAWFYITLCTVTLVSLAGMAALGALSLQTWKSGSGPTWDLIILAIAAAAVAAIPPATLIVLLEIESSGALDRLEIAAKLRKLPGAIILFAGTGMSGAGLALLIVAATKLDAGMLIPAIPLSIGGPAAWKCGSRLMAGRAPGGNGAAAPGQETHGPDTQGAE